MGRHERRVIGVKRSGVIEDEGVNARTRCNYFLTALRREGRRGKNK